MNALRNIAIIAHVDHGKTTLVDKLLQQSGTLSKKNLNAERIMDFNDQEKERGITITAKNTALEWNNYRINIVDTPGHADFGGEVERVLTMVDSVLLLVDAAEGPMPQTRFVTQKAFEFGLNPIVAVNKIDKPAARSDWVIDQVFDLFDQLGGTDEQMDFPIVYTSALNGIAGLNANHLQQDMTPLFQTIIDHAPSPQVDPQGSLQMQLSALDYSSYIGVIGIGRIQRGEMHPNQAVTVIDKDGRTRRSRVLQIMGYRGLDRINLDKATAGDIVCVTGLENANISDTLCDPDYVESLPALTIDEPTISMSFQVNDSPFVAKEGKFLSSRQIKERLEQELIHNVALRVEQGNSADKFNVSGRGELHLSVLIETMRREGFELAVSRPEVIIRETDGIQQEPYEDLVITCEEQHQGTIIEALGQRQGELKNFIQENNGRVRLEYLIPSRGLIGFRSELLTSTSGTGILTSIFSHYGKMVQQLSNQRTNGVLVSMATGKALGYSLFNLQERGKLFINPGVNVYEGMVIGIHSRGNDLVVNPTKGKKLDNMRASGSDENILLTPPIIFSLEQALQFIEDDELVEITPRNIRIRKKLLLEHERKRHRFHA